MENQRWTIGTCHFRSSILYPLSSILYPLSSDWLLLPRVGRLQRRPHVAVRSLGDQFDDELVVVNAAPVDIEVLFGAVIVGVAGDPLDGLAVVLAGAGPV